MCGTSPTRKSVVREILPSNSKCDAPENVANNLVKPIQLKFWGQYHIYDLCFAAVCSFEKDFHSNVMFQAKLSSHTHLFICFGEFICSYFVYYHNHTKYVFAAHEGGGQHVFSGVSCLLVHKVTEPGILRHKYREVLHSLMFNTAVSSVKKAYRSVKNYLLQNIG